MVKRDRTILKKAFIRKRSFYDAINGVDLASEFKFFDAF